MVVKTTQLKNTYCDDKYWLTLLIGGCQGSVASEDKKRAIQCQHFEVLNGLRKTFPPISISCSFMGYGG
jgi:hypothetical protein